MPAVADSQSRLDWFLTRLGEGPNAFSEDEIRDAWVTELPAAPPPTRARMLAHFARGIGTFTIEHREARESFAAARLRDSKGRAWRAWLQLEPNGGGRILAAYVTLCAPPGWTIRPAGPSDARALRDLERRCPIVMGDVRVTYDRGADYFAGARLVGDMTASVAERDGDIAALHCMLTHQLRIAGLQFNATYLHHSRIREDAQGAGLFSALNGTELERHAETQSFYAYVAVGNEAALRIIPVPQWKNRPERVVIDCRAQAGPDCGRPASPEDAGRVAELINLAHEREELFVPYSIERLTSRVTREPASYGWQDLLLGQKAVVGVWNAGLRVSRETPSGHEDSVRALVLDTGFQPGAEAELVALLRAWCSRLLSHGTRHLTVFTSPGSPGRDGLHSLASRVEGYHFNIGVPEPEDVSTHGLYVDQLYF